jgi:hypothetical protein
VRLRIAAALLVGIALAGCGGDDGGGGSGPPDLFAYLPSDAGAVAVVDLNLDGEPVRALEDALQPHVLEGNRDFEQLAASTAGAPSWDLIEVLIGDRMVVGAPEELSTFDSLDAGASAFVGAVELDDETSMRGALERVSYSKSGSEHGADIYEGGGPPVAFDDGVLVFAYSREVLTQALERQEAGGVLFTREQMDRATTGLPADAPVRVYVNLARITGQRALRGMRKVPWVDALRTGALTVSGSDGALVVDAVANTEAESLTDGDLPFPPGAPATEAPTRRDAVNSGSANQSQTTAFLLEVLRAWRPAGRFAKDVATVERKRRIDLDEEVLRQFDGPSSSSLTSTGQFGARSTVADPRRMERTLRMIAPDVLSDSEVDVERVDGQRALYRMGKIVFGLIGDAFVVASDERLAQEAARAPTAPVPGTRGASVLHARATDQLRGLAERAIGFDPGPRGELTGSVQASRDRLHATARLRMP